MQKDVWVSLLDAVNLWLTVVRNTHATRVLVVKTKNGELISSSCVPGSPEPESTGILIKLRV